MKPGGIHRYFERDPSLLYFVPLGYQVPRYFESPRYDRGEDDGYDTRNTILWAPEVVIDGGRATIEFCNTDRPDFPYVIRIEGMSADGHPFSTRKGGMPKLKELLDLDIVTKEEFEAKKKKLLDL